MIQFVQPQDTTDVLTWTIDLARSAGKQAQSFFGATKEKQFKGHPNDYATEVDIAIEKFLVEQIQDRFPGDAILAEEGGWYGGYDAEHVWIIDPIDGTSNFANGIPEYGVMIARARGDVVQLSVVYNPTQEVIASAQRGAGTMLNGTVITATTPPDISAINAIIGHTYDRFQKEIIEKLRKECDTRIRNHRTFHSAAASALHLLQADYDVYAINTMKTWDTAPISLLFEEAGYMMTTLTGAPYAWKNDDQSVLVAHPQLHTLFSEWIQKI